MASYLGKISALVTANVLPFRAALQESNRDLNRWRSQVNSTLNQAASGNWEQKILTKFQQVRQAIAAAQSGQLDFPGFDARKVEQMFSAIEQIQKPLAKARDEFETFSSAIQSRLLSAFQDVQREALLMRDLIEAGFEIDPAGFDDLQRRVDGIVASIKRLGELSSKTGGLVSGAEFRFQAPEASAALDRTRRLQQEAATAFGAGDVQNMALYRTQASLASSLAGTRADIERVMSEGGDVTALVQREKTFAEALERTNDTLKKRIGLQKQSDDVAQTRAKRADSLDRPFRDVIEDRAFNRTSQQISFFGNELARIGVQAGGPVESAFNNLTKAASQFASAGTVGAKANQQELKRLQQELVKTLVDTKELTKAQGRALLRSAGDIGRAGYDKLSLGVQQAAFAVEDFFSVTGGLDQRIRAASNNVSQLGFILGGTTGLIVGISASIGGQLLAAIYKWTQAGITAELQTKALNEALQQQSSAVSELAQAYKSLASSISGKAMAGPSREASEFADQLADIAKRQKEIRDERVAGMSPAVAGERVNIARLEDELAKSTSVGQRAALRRELEQSRVRERRAMRDAASLARPESQEVLGAILRSIGGNREVDDINRRAAKARVDAATGDVDGLIEALEMAASRRQPVAQLSGGLFAMLMRGAASGFGDYASMEDVQNARRDIAEIESLINRLRSFKNLDDVTRNILESGNRLSDAISLAAQASQEMQKAGVAGAMAVLAAIEDPAKRLKKAMDALQDAVNLPESDPTRAQRIEDARRQVARADQERGVVDQAELDARYRMTVLPGETAVGRIATARQMLLESGSPEGMLAYRLRVLENDRETIRQQMSARQGGAADPILQQADDELTQLAEQFASAALQIQAFSRAVNAAAAEVQSNLSAAEQRADEARRSDLRLGTPDSNRRRKEAEGELEDARQAQRAADAAFARERSRIEEDALNGRGPLAGEFDRLRQINEQLASGEDAQGRPLAAEDRYRLEDERRAIRAEIDAATAASPAVQAARDDSTRMAEFAAAADRGRELSMTPSQRAARDLQQQLNDINAFFGMQAEQGSGLVDVDARNKAMARAVADSVRQAAPTLMGFSDEIANARLQGPSRAALAFTDVATMEGSRELNRLLRGDDPSRDVNLVELQRQTELLGGILDAARNFGVPVAD